MGIYGYLRIRGNGAILTKPTQIIIFAVLAFLSPLPLCPLNIVQKLQCRSTCQLALLAQDRLVSRRNRVTPIHRLTCRYYRVDLLVT